MKDIKAGRMKPKKKVLSPITPNANSELIKVVVALLDNIGIDVNDVDEQGCSHLVQDALHALKQARFNQRGNTTFETA